MTVTLCNVIGYLDHAWDWLVNIDVCCNELQLDIEKKKLK